jgi:Uma2 family endonuclease
MDEDDLPDTLVAAQVRRRLAGGPERRCPAYVNSGMAASEPAGGCRMSTGSQVSARRRVMPVELERRRFTVEEYHRMSETGVLREDDRVELIGGEIIMMSPIGPRHAYYVNRLTRVLVQCVGQAGEVAVQNPVEVTDESEPQPDVAVIVARGRHYYDCLPGKHDVLLAIEVADSSLDKDRHVKIPLYGAAGVPESWILIVDEAIIERYTQPGPGAYGKVDRLGAGDRVTLVSIPECTIDLSHVLGG